MTTTVVDVPERQRYEVVRGEAVLGFAAYQKTDQLIVFTHTEVDRSLEGLGIGGQLVRGALDHVRSCRAGWHGTPSTPTSTTGGLRPASSTERSLPTGRLSLTRAVAR
jgi:predicted GNAT family acetyltransferase